ATGRAGSSRAPTWRISSLRRSTTTSFCIRLQFSELTSRCSRPEPRTPAKIMQPAPCWCSALLKIAPRWPDMNLAAEYEFGAPCRGCVAYRYRRVATMTVHIEPFASVYEDRSRLGVILARGRSGFEAYAADDHSLGLFPSPRKAAV